jgi:hypothetical protein
MEGKILFVSFLRQDKKIGIPIAIGNRTTVLDTQKIAAPKKSSTFAFGFLISLLKTKSF